MLQGSAALEDVEKAVIDFVQELPSTARGKLLAKLWDALEEMPAAEDLAHLEGESLKRLILMQRHPDVILKSSSKASMTAYIARLSTVPADALLPKRCRELILGYWGQQSSDGFQVSRHTKGKN